MSGMGRLAWVGLVYFGKEESTATVLALELVLTAAYLWFSGSREGTYEGMHPTYFGRQDARDLGSRRNVLNVPLSHF